MDNIHQVANSVNTNLSFGEFFLVEETLGDRLKRFARTRYGTQKAMAKALGMPESQLSGYIKGTKAPASDVMERLRRVGVSIDWLLSGKGHPDLYGEGDEPEDGAIEFLSGGPPQDEYLIFDVETKQMYTQEQYNELLRVRSEQQRRGNQN